MVAAPLRSTTRPSERPCEPHWRLLAAMLAASLAVPQVALGSAQSPAASAAVLAGPNLAAGKSATASSVNQNYVASNVTDGNQSTYWESANNAFPQWVQVDLGSSVSTNQVVLKLPTAGWGARNQTLAVQGSTDGQNFNDLSASAVPGLQPAGQHGDHRLRRATVRYLRIRITANTGWPAGQLSELEVYGPSTGDTQAPTAPGSLAFTEPAAGQIRLTWTAARPTTSASPGTTCTPTASCAPAWPATSLTYTDTSRPARRSATSSARKMPQATSRRTATR